TEACGSLTVNFTDNSTNNPSSWAWDFGDGETSNEQNPTHIYNTLGTYSVSLTVANEFGDNTLELENLISVFEVPELFVNVNNASGEDVADGSAELAIVGGVEPYYIYWSNGEENIDAIYNLLPDIYSVMVIDANNCMATIPFTISWEVGIASNLSDNINIYPNPTKGFVYIETTKNIPESISISDVLGKTILEINPTSDISKLDLNELKAGIYFVSIKLKDNNIVHRLIVN
ncbi:MAG: PKD domain-containing protein, partial [Bacteroidales bacterium]|nr:PKD domain-containing protein [Bacteroidales bacterium]